MENYVPDIYQKSIETINYKKLKESGIKCLLFDLDNTLVPYHEKRPSKKLRDFFKGLKKQGFNVIIFSNSGKKRLTPFKEELEVDVCPRAFKPSPKKFKVVMETYDYNESEIAIIGDQFYTDILGGNRVGITTILINPICKKDMIFTYFARFKEKGLIKKLSNANLFYRGKFYD